MTDQSGQRPPVIVALPAQIDLTSQDWAYDLLYAAFASGAGVVVADFTATTFCDCSSLRRLLAVRHRAAARNAKLRFAMPPGSMVRRVAQLTGLDCMMEVYSSPQEAEKGRPVSVMREG